MTMLQHGLVPSTGGYRIERSLRFNSADTAYLDRTFSSGDRQKFTLNVWVKRSQSGARSIFTCGSSASSFVQFRFNSADTLYILSENPSTVMDLETTQVFRDYSAWYMITLAVDTTQATASNRVKLYVNGSQVTAFSSATYPSQNTNLLVNSNIAHYLGALSFNTAQNLYGGYMADISFIDGSQKAASDFGETDTDTGVWKPKAYSGSYGTNGFYLKFADNSGTTSTTLGKDSSGNGNNWTPNNFSVTAGAGNDSLVDTPTPYGTDTGAGGEVRGNYCTLNSTRNTTSTQGTFSNGNLQIAGTNGVNNCYAAGTMAFAGKMYCEITITAAGGDTTTQGVGIVPIISNQTAVANSMSTGIYYIINGNKRVTGTSSSYGSSYTTGDIIGIAVDVDAETVTFYKNNVSQGSISGTGVISAGVLAYIGFQDGGSPSITANFGQRPFAYTAPSGFKALCTQNLPTPTIGATATTRADRHFTTNLWAGNNGSQTITNNIDTTNGGGLIWFKGRDLAISHFVVNSNSGYTKFLAANTTAAEDTYDFGFTPSTTGFSFNNSSGSVNQSGYNYVAWQWKANGAGSSNTAGTITSTVSANTTAGFSVVTYTGTGANATVGHGLGVAPQMVIVKNRTSVINWPVWHIGLTSGAYAILLDTQGAEYSQATVWNSTTPTSSVISVGTVTETNKSGDNYVAYCFAPVANYSSFGKYVGNGSTDGPFVYTGFRPRYVITKRTNSTSNWTIQDTARSSYNVINAALFANSSTNENTGPWFDLVSNGFKVRSDGSDTNANTGTYVYMAFAENPFKYSLAR